MSQQEFYEESQLQEQGQQPREDDEIYYPPQPYYWSTKPNISGTPKEEPASRYDEPMIEGDYQADYQHGYMAQDTNVHAYQQSGRNKRSDTSIPYATTSRSGSAGSQRSQRQQFSPDGDSFESRYRPYNANNNQQWSVPPWARPQQHKKNPARLFWLVILGLMFINPLLHILGAMLVVAGVIVFAVILLFLFGAMMVPYLVFRAATGRPAPGRSWHYRSYRRRPWGW